MVERRGASLSNVEAGEMAMIGAVITLIVYAIILGLLYWLAEYLLGIFPLPDPAGRIVRAAIVVIIVIVLISVLLDVLGVASTGVPRLRWQ